MSMPNRSLSIISNSCDKQNQLIREVRRRVAKNTFLSAEDAENGEGQFWVVSFW